MTFYGVVQAALERTRPRGPEADAPPSSRSSVQRDAASHASLALEKLKSAVEEKIESLQSRIAESFSGPGAFRNHSSISIRGYDFPPCPPSIVPHPL